VNPRAAAEWMRSAYGDLVLIEEISDNDSHQSIEKSLKAIYEYHEMEVLKKHDLLLLKCGVEKHIEIGDEDALEELNDLYIESRYPGDMGLLPSGKPSVGKAAALSRLAQEIFDEVCNALGIDPAEVKR
jgi:HEPN domain-containing protein